MRRRRFSAYIRRHDHRSSEPYLNALILLLLLGAATAAEAQLKPELARRYFEEACMGPWGRRSGISSAHWMSFYHPDESRFCVEIGGTTQRKCEGL